MNWTSFPVLHSSQGADERSSRIVDSSGKLVGLNVVLDAEGRTSATSTNTETCGQKQGIRHMSASDDLHEDITVVKTGGRHRAGQTRQVGGSECCAAGGPEGSASASQIGVGAGEHGYERTLTLVNL